jgi:uncharacterized lipoprotein NlpE involved in copper resistance
MHVPNHNRKELIMKKYFLVTLFTITLALVGCNDDDDSSSSPPKISGWGTPPPIVTPTTTDEAKEMLNLSAQVSGRVHEQYADAS